MNLSPLSFIIRSLILRRSVIPGVQRELNLRWPLRAFLLVLALLVPLNLAFSVPPVGREAMLGWSSELHHHGDEEAIVVTRTLRFARVAGLLPGDELLEVNGRVADTTGLRVLLHTAQPGDTIHLRVARAGATSHVQLVATRASASYHGYFVFGVVVALASWLVGLSVIAWRGDHLAALVVGAALLLIAPSTFSSGNPGDAALFGVARYAWQLQAAAYRFFFPVLLLHFLALSFSRPRFLRSSSFWAVVYLALLSVLAATTDLFRSPLAWTQLGAARDLRNMAGFAAELVLVITALCFRGSPRLRPVVRAWMGMAILFYATTGLLRSTIELGFGEWGGTEFVTQLNSLMLVLLPTLTLIYFFAPVTIDATEWRVRSWLQSTISVSLTVLYGIAVVGIVATVLNSTRRDLGGVEWILFGAVFLSTIIFSPLLRAARDMVEQRMWTRWSQRKEQASEFSRAVGAELKLERIAQRVASELPRLLECPTVSLVIARDVAERWQIEGSAVLIVEERITLMEYLRSATENGSLWVAIKFDEETLLGALRIERRMDGADNTPPEEALRSLVAQGVSASLRNSEAFLELMRSQQELAESERIASVGALGGGLAHEIKNPLAGLKMALHIIRRDGVNDGRLARMDSDLRRIDDLVSGLLRHTRSGPVEAREWIPVVDSVKAAVADLRPLAEDRGTMMLENYPKHEVHIRGGAAQLRLVVSNLVVNALDAVAEGDLVEVSVSVLPVGELEIAIRDTGTGIPLAIRSRIFEPDFTTKDTGSGLGLSIARREVERLGGSIMVHSADPNGTVLRVIFAPAILQNYQRPANISGETDTSAGALSAETY